ncbi:SH3 domain-containing kinase-binding protein 1 [Polymixia lowei]
MEVERKETKEKREGLDSIFLKLQENTRAASNNDSPPLVVEPKTYVFTKCPSAHSPKTLGQLQTELRDLKDEMDLMKTQHNKEIKLLMNELDEEKKIRLTLQLEIQRIKKHMSK